MQQAEKKPAVAIDGPAGAGKSTVARQVAKELGYIYIDTGAMYRAITLKAIQQGIDLENQEKLTQIAKNTEIRLAYKEHTQVIFMDGEDVSAEIRLPMISQNVSYVAKVPGVRIEMVELQRSFARVGGVIMDGRDIGSYVLPDAECKIFLTASISERARRRAKDLQVTGHEVDLKSLEKEIAMRDEIDSTREMSPLMRAPDAILIDSSIMTFEQVVQKVKECIINQCGS